MKNKVIIIGGDHSNTLGVVRALGENNIKPYVYIISESSSTSISKSVYVREAFVYKSESQALGDIEERFLAERYKPIIIPTSDNAAAIVDQNYDRLSKRFITQNIQNSQNKIVELMDKERQYEIGTKMGLTMAKTISLCAPFNLSKLDNMKYPIIIKPQLSIDGKKEDIRIAKTLEQLKKHLSTFNQHGYKRVVLQEKIDYDFECDMSGFSYDHNISIVGYIQKERIWPKQRGSLTYGKVRTIDNAQEVINKIKILINHIGYTGLFDVEFFVKNDTFFLNEINFRNSGLTYLYGDSYLCYYYVLSCINGSFMPAPIVKNDYFVMDEQAEIHQLIERNITLRKHLSDSKKSKKYLVKNKADKRPGRIMIRNKILNNLHLHGIVSLAEKASHTLPETVLMKLQKSKTDTQFNSDYPVEIITIDNINNLPEEKGNIKDIKKALKHKKIYGIALKDKGRYIAWGFLRKKGARDRFVVIKNNHSWLVGNQYVIPEYRGKGLQRIVTSTLIKTFVEDKGDNIYAVVYRYNIPSWKNLQKNGFKKIEYFTVHRFAKKSFGKKAI